MDMPFPKPNISGRNIMVFLFRYSRPFLIFIFFLIFGYGLFIWYENAYRGEWSEEQKEQYAETAFEETVFRERAFDRAIEFYSDRAKRHERSVSVERDYFFPKLNR